MCQSPACFTFSFSYIYIRTLYDSFACICRGLSYNTQPLLKSSNRQQIDEAALLSDCMCRDQIKTPPALLDSSRASVHIS